MHNRRIPKNRFLAILAIFALAVASAAAVVAGGANVTAAPQVAQYDESSGSDNNSTTADLAAWRNKRRHPAPKPTPTPTPTPGQTLSFYVTGYGQPDNDPPGPAIAYPGSAPRHQGTAGVGSYADPVTIAVGTDWGTANLKPGTRIYLAVFKKYGIIEDECAACHGKWIDVYDGSKAKDNPNKVAACQNTHTGTYAVEINPPNGKPVNTAPLYNNGVCTP